MVAPYLPYPPWFGGAVRIYHLVRTLAREHEVTLLALASLAEREAARPLSEVCAAVHTVDQIGWDNDNDRRFELELPTQTLEAEYRAAAAIVGVPVAVTSTQGTDHQAFRDDGFAAKVRARRGSAADAHGLVRLRDEGRVAVRVGEHRDGSEAALAAAAQDATRDLAAIRDEELPDRSSRDAHAHIRKTP